MRSVVSAARYAAALRNNGDVYAWGWGGDVGQAIGSGSLDNPLPARVSGLANIAAISTRYHHTLALDTAGRVFGFGPEASGALGPLLGNDAARPIATPADVRQIAAGEAHSLVLLADGTVWAWGRNDLGQLGLADPATVTTPTLVPGLTQVKAIAASSFGSFALKQDGSVWSWGRAETLGRPAGPVAIARVDLAVAATSLAAGNYNVSAVTATGEVYGWGSNYAGRVGVGSSAETIVTPTLLPGLPPVAEVIGGESVGLASARDGRVFAWGSNAERALDGTTRPDSAVPVDTGFRR